MTKEEAIQRFQRMKKILAIPNSDAERTAEAIDMAIEALNTDIVRCWECKKQFTNDCYMIYGKNMMRNLFDNDFCSYGERGSNVSEEEKEYLNKVFPEHDGGEWFDITDIITKGETE